MWHRLYKRAPLRGLLELMATIVGLRHRARHKASHLYVTLSNAARSQYANVAPASYVLCRNSNNTSSGATACRTSSYNKMCCDSSELQKALRGRMSSRSNPAEIGNVYA